MVEVAGRDVPFGEAIRFFRQKVRLPTETWTDLWQGMHARAFVVAGAMRDELIADFQEAVAKALEQGTTLAEFRKDFDRIVARHGWSYRGGRGWRSRVIFETNLRTAHMAGRWEQIQRVKDRRPFLRYVAVLDSRTRPAHRAWHGTVLSVDDDWWNSHYPPNGWNCRCTVQSLSARDLERFGHKESDEAPPLDPEPRTVNTPDGPVPIEVPHGIDPGWSYNVGEAAFGRGRQRLALARHGPPERLLSPGGSRPADPGPVPVDSPRASTGPLARDESALRAALRDAIGGDEVVFTDPAGGRVAVTQAIVDHFIESQSRRDGREAYFPLIPEIIREPAEIWVGFDVPAATGRVRLLRRYVKVVRLDRDRVVGFIADSDGGAWSGFTFFRGRLSALNNLRWGLRIYRRE